MWAYFNRTNTIWVFIKTKLLPPNRAGYHPSFSKFKKSLKTSDSFHRVSKFINVPLSPRRLPRPTSVTKIEMDTAKKTKMKSHAVHYREKTLPSWHSASWNLSLHKTKALSSHTQWAQPNFLTAHNCTSNLIRLESTFNQLKFALLLLWTFVMQSSRLYLL